MTETRTCTTCMKAFPLTPEFFYKDASKSGGFTSECKSCKKARSRENSKKHYALAKAVKEATKRRSPAEAFVAFGDVAAKPKPQNRGGRRVNHMARLGKAIAQEAKRLQHEQELAAQPLKACLVCQEEKPLGLFNKDPRTADGRSNVCKACKAEQRKAKVEGREGPKAIKPV
ncbi:MAG: hypothetical protein HRT82_17150, partial [Henriciella sp.]|nr:hypothetical protein [Henriciella sp.]